MRYLDESWALDDKRDRKDACSLAAAGLPVRGPQTTLRAAGHHLYLK